MTTIIDNLGDLERKATAGTALTHDEAARVLAATDLISIGALADLARRRRAGDTVTFGRVSTVVSAASIVPGAAGEVRLETLPGSVEETVALVRSARAAVRDVPLTGFSLADLLAMAGSGPLPFDALCRELRAAGLDAVAASPVDRAESLDDLVSAIDAARAAGLGVWRLTVERAVAGERLQLIERAAELQARVGGLCAFAPLPRQDPADVPSTGYDDVRTVAVASLVCTAIPFIQVDWPLYGPKLAQVALAYGANDVDGIAAVDDAALGPRRSSVEEIRRQITAAAAVPAERNGRYERRR